MQSTTQPSSDRQWRGTWQGMPLSRIQGISEIQKCLPTFDRRPFRVTTGLTALTGDNPNYDVVVRLPVLEGEAETPVGVVSKTYSLIQHRAVLDLALNALQANRVRAGCKAELVMTGLGERVDLRLTLPREHDFDPGDGHPLGLQLRCINSVDGSTRFMLVIGWFRFVCRNGLIVGTATTRVRRIHNGSLDSGDVAAAVRAGLTMAVQDRPLFTRWVETSISDVRLTRWANTSVRKMWGVKAATRALYIARTGQDVRLKPFEGGLPSERTVEVVRSVPGGSKGSVNAYSVSQALAWLARDRRDHQQRLDWMLQIPELMRDLQR